MRELLHDVPAAEHRLHVHPHVLHDEPHLDDIPHGRELDDPVLDARLKRRGVPVRRHRPQGHLRVLEAFDELPRRRRLQQDVTFVLKLREVEVQVLPLLRDLRELRLHLRLLHRTGGEVLDVVRVRQDVRVEQIRELELVLSQVELDADDLLQRLPVPVAHGLIRERLNERQHLEELVDLLPQVHVRVPLSQRLRELPALRLELRHLLGHRVEIGRDVRPQDVGVPVHGADHRGVQVVQAVQKLELLLRLLELGVLRDRQPEERLAGAVLDPLAFPRREELRKFPQPLDSLRGLTPRHHRPVRVPVLAKLRGVDDEDFHVLQELALEPHLQPREVFAHGRREQRHPRPAVPQLSDEIRLLVRHLHLVAVQKRVHLLDRPQQGVELGLLHADVLLHVHDDADVVQVLHLAVQTHRRVLHVLVNVLQLPRAVLVEVLRELRLPRRGFRLEREL